MEDKRSIKTGKILCGLSIALGLALALFFYLSLNEKSVQRQFQRSVSKMDNEMCVFDETKGRIGERYHLSVAFGKLLCEIV